MKVNMIYHTPELHKLVEAVARICYQSYDKMSPTSHSMLKGIMKRGHLSVASVGNMVFEISLSDASLEDIVDILDSLTIFKQISNYVRWTTPAHKDTREGVITVSMNMLTLLDILHGEVEFTRGSTSLLNDVLDAVEKVPYLHWFLEPSTEILPSDSNYIGSPELYAPVILSEDYTALKALGLTDYELDTHSTVTVDLVVDRATGLQAWRHTDMTGGCELSQRYCDRSNAAYRELVGINEYPELLSLYAEKEGLTIEEAREHYDAVVKSLYNQIQKSIDFYSDVKETLKELGVSESRSKEIARAVLPNDVLTRIIQCRPLRQWKHFIGLRDTVHAQPEIYADTQALKKAFDKVGIVYA